jgi:hypothetical protein
VSDRDHDEITVWLNASIEDLYLPELEDIGRWGTLIHALLIKNLPENFMALSSRKRVREFLAGEQAHLAVLALTVARRWRKENRPPSLSHTFNEMAWFRASQAYADTKVWNDIVYKYRAR